MPNDPITEPALTLIDIEPPIAPDPTWLDSNEWILAGGLLLLCLALVIPLIKKFSPRYKRSQLHRKLSKLAPNKALNTEEIPRQQAYLLYQYCLEIQHFLPPHSIQKHTDLNQLIEQIKPLCFSQATVSRETYHQLLSQAKQLLESSQ